MGMPIYRPCMANNSAGTKLGAASHSQILSLGVVPFKGGRSVFFAHPYCSMVIAAKPYDGLPYLPVMMRLE